MIKLFCTYDNTVIGDPIPIGSPIIVTIWKFVFANKSRKLRWIWMKLGTWGWGLKRVSLARFQWNRAMGFGDSAKNGSQRRCFLWREPRTNSATFLGSISAKLPTNTCPGSGSRHVVSHSRKVSIKGSNLPKNPLFRVPICDQPMGHGKRSMTPTLFPSPSGHPTDVPS